MQNGLFMRNLKSNRMHGIKAGGYTESKMTNWTSFDPIGSEIDKIYNKYFLELQKISPSTKYFEEPLSKGFVRPVSTQEVKNEINRIPSTYSAGIQGVFLLGGSAKTLKTSRSLFSYGTYWNNCIFIHPYPKNRLVLRYQNSPRPHILNDYKRVGAVVKKSDPKGVVISFSEEALKKFYLRDVVVHEVGHHVERYVEKSHVKSEGFAEWFATEFGFRLR
jgi:hypothetical protein